MADFSFWDWVWWSLGFIVLPVTWFVWSQWQSHKTYGEMRERIARIGSPWTCPSCPHPEHPMICLECGCDMMTNPRPAARGRERDLCSQCSNKRQPDDDMCAACQTGVARTVAAFAAEAAASREGDGDE